MSGAGLVLEAVEASGPLRWRWLLTDAETGAPLADHRVDLDPAVGEVARFGDLYGYARSYAAPDRRVADEARIVAEAGAWAGRRCSASRSARRSRRRRGGAGDGSGVGPGGGPVLLWPLELAHADGGPLAARGDVSFVYDIAPEGPPSARTGWRGRCGCSRCSPSRRGPACWRCGGSGTRWPG